MGLIDEIKAKADLLQYVEQFTELKPQSGGTRFTGKCPIHREEKGSSFFIFPEDERWHCFGKCDRGGSIIDFEMGMMNLWSSADLGPVIDKLCDHYQIEKKAYEKATGPTTNKAYARKLVMEYSHQKLMEGKEFEAARQWLIERDFTVEDMKYWLAGVGTGTMKKDLKDKIAHQTMIDIGILGHKTTEKEGLRTWDYVKPGVIMIPIFNMKGKPSHWCLRNPDKKDDYQMYKKCRDDDWQGDSLNIFNIGDLIKYPDPFGVEGVWDVNQIKKRQKPAFATLGKPTDHQIDFINFLRKPNAIFPEKVKRKTIYWWYDRDENEAGQDAAERAASKTYQHHDVYVVKAPNLGDDPDDHLRKRKLTLDDLERVPWNESIFDIEATDKGYIWNEPMPGGGHISKGITNFTMDIKYHFVGLDQDRTKMVKINRKGEKNGHLFLKGEDTYGRRQFLKWLHRKTRTCNFEGSDEAYDRLTCYLRENDHSRTIAFSQYYGNISPGIWLFDNGVIKDGEILRADQDGIVWMPYQGHEGIRTARQTEAEDEDVLEQLIPEEYFSLREIIDNTLKFYPIEMAMVMIGYAAATFCRTKIARYFSCFSHLLMKGDSDAGKTKALNLVRSWLNAAEAPTDTCDTTSKAFMRHIAAFINMPLELTEYVSKFEGVMKNIYDQNLYSKAKNTGGNETTNPVVNTSVIFTCEHTPTGKSLINRCMILDFDEFKYDPKARGDYDEFWDQCVNERKGFGFLLELCKSDITDHILKRIKELGQALVRDKRIRKGSSRLINTYAIVFGAFSAVYNLPNHRAYMRDRFKIGGKELSLDYVIDIIAEMVRKSTQMIEGQDTLQTFFGLTNTLYNAGPLRDLIQLLPTKEVPDKVRFHLGDVFNIVIQHDNRGKQMLKNITMTDISKRIREKYDVVAKSDKYFGENKSCYTLPYASLANEFHATFMPVDRIDEVDTSFNPDLIEEDIY